YLQAIKPYHFDSVEIQTNALLFATKPEKYDLLLAKWREAGLGTIAISIGHYEREKNHSIYTKTYPYTDLPATIDTLHGLGYKLRLSCAMMGRYIDTPEKVQSMVDFVLANKVEQLTLRQLSAVEDSQNPDVTNWTRQH